LHETDQNLGGRDCYEYDGSSRGCFNNRDCTKRHCFRAIGSTELCPGFLHSGRCEDPKSCKLRHGSESAASRADFRQRRDANRERFQKPSRASSAGAVANSFDSSHSEGNSEAIETVMQMAGVSRSEAVQALIESSNEPLTAAIVRQASVCFTASILVTIISRFYVNVLVCA
jgi:hypothetical protein